VVHREAERRFQHLFAVEARAEAQVEPRDAREQLARELHTAAGDEEVHHREVVRAAHEADAVALPTQHECQRAAGAGVGVDEKDVPVAHHPGTHKSKGHTIPN
jgi:hypothetical protein